MRKVTTKNGCGNLTDDRKKRTTDPDIPVSAADLASKPPRVHIKDMNPDPKGRAVMSANEFAKKAKKKPLSKKKTTAGVAKKN